MNQPHSSDHHQHHQQRPRSLFGESASETFSLSSSVDSLGWMKEGESLELSQQLVGDSSSQPLACEESSLLLRRDSSSQPSRKQRIVRERVVSKGAFQKDLDRTLSTDSDTSSSGNEESTSYSGESVSLGKFIPAGITTTRTPSSTKTSTTTTPSSQMTAGVAGPHTPMKNVGATSGGILRNGYKKKMLNSNFDVFDNKDSSVSSSGSEAPRPPVRRQDSRDDLELSMRSSATTKHHENEAANDEDASKKGPRRRGVARTHSKDDMDLPSRKIGTARKSKSLVGDNSSSSIKGSLKSSLKSSKKYDALGSSSAHTRSTTSSSDIAPRRGLVRQNSKDDMYLAMHEKDQRSRSRSRGRKITRHNSKDDLDLMLQRTPTSSSIAERAALFGGTSGSVKVVRKVVKKKKDSSTASSAAPPSRRSLVRHNSKDDLDLAMMISKEAPRRRGSKKLVRDDQSLMSGDSGKAIFDGHRAERKSSLDMVVSEGPGMVIRVNKESKNALSGATKKLKRKKSVTGSKSPTEFEPIVAAPPALVASTSQPIPRRASPTTTITRRNMNRRGSLDSNASGASDFHAYTALSAEETTTSKVGALASRSHQADEEDMSVSKPSTISKRVSSTPSKVMLRPASDRRFARRGSLDSSVSGDSIPSTGAMAEESAVKKVSKKSSFSAVKKVRRGVQRQNSKDDMFLEMGRTGRERRQKQRQAAVDKEEEPQEAAQPRAPLRRGVQRQNSKDDMFLEMGGTGRERRQKQRERAEAKDKEKEAPAAPVRRGLQRHNSKDDMFLEMGGSGRERRTLRGSSATEKNQVKEESKSLRPVRRGVQRQNSKDDMFLEMGGTGRERRERRYRSTVKSSSGTSSRNSKQSSFLGDASLYTTPVFQIRLNRPVTLVQALVRGHLQRCRNKEQAKAKKLPLAQARIRGMQTRKKVAVLFAKLRAEQKVQRTVRAATKIQSVCRVHLVKKHMVLVRMEAQIRGMEARIREVEKRKQADLAQIRARTEAEKRAILSEAKEEAKLLELELDQNTSLANKADAIIKHFRQENKELRLKNSKLQQQIDKLSDENKRLEAALDKTYEQFEQLKKTIPRLQEDTSRMAEIHDAFVNRKRNFREKRDEFIELKVHEETLCDLVESRIREAMDHIYERCPNKFLAEAIWNAATADLTRTANMAHREKRAVEDDEEEEEKEEKEEEEEESEEEASDDSDDEENSDDDSDDDSDA